MHPCASTSVRTFIKVRLTFGLEARLPTNSETELPKSSAVISSHSSEILWGVGVLNVAVM